MPRFSYEKSVMDSNLQSTTKLLLLALATYMNKHGDAVFPSQKTLSEKTSLSERAIIKHIQIAVEKGFIEKTDRGFKGQKWNAKKYKLTLPDDVRGVNEVHVRGERGSCLGVNEVHVYKNKPLEQAIEHKIIIKDFENWWKLYPRKIGKQAAKRKYEKYVKEKTITEKLLMDALKRQLPELKQKEEQYIPHPATWLNQGRWDDEVKENGSSAIW